MKKNLTSCLKLWKKSQKNDYAVQVEFQTDIKKILTKYKNADAKNPKLKLEKDKAIAQELLKTASISDEVIARITNLKVKNVLIFRKRLKKLK